jgi:hypothetical protein
MLHNIPLGLFGAAKAWLVGVLNTLSQNTFGGYQTYTFRQVIDANTLAFSGSKIRITFLADAARTWVVDEVYFNHAATSGDAYDYIGTPTQMTFSGGSAGFSLTAGQSILSDEITFAFDKTKAFVIAMDWVNTGSHGCATNTSASGWTTYEKVGDDAQTVDATGYTSHATTIAGVLKIEVFG